MQTTSATAGCPVAARIATWHRWTRPAAHRTSSRFQLSSNSTISTSTNAWWHLSSFCSRSSSIRSRLSTTAVRRPVTCRLGCLICIESASMSSTHTTMSSCSYCELFSTRRIFSSPMPSSGFLQWLVSWWTARVWLSWTISMRLL